MLRCSLNLLLSTPPTTGNCKDGILTAALSHSGTPSTLLIGVVASAVCKSRATLRLTALLLNTAPPPTLARARIRATLWVASPLQRLLLYLVCRRLARGTPTIQPVGRLESVSILYPYQWMAVGLYTQRNLNAASWRMLARGTTSVSQTWMDRIQRLLLYLVCRRLKRGTPTIQPVGRLESVSILYPYQWMAVGLYTQRNLNAASWRMLARGTTSVAQTWMGCPLVSMALSGTPSMILLIFVQICCLFPWMAIL